MKNSWKFASAALLGVVLLATTVIVSHPTAAEEQAAGRKFAFLVGVVKYNHAKLRNLEYAEADVEELADVLRKQGFQEVLVLTSRTARDNPGLQPTAENVRARLREFLSKARLGKDDLVLVGLAGHGIQPLGSDESYFCPFDANPTMMAEKTGQPPVPTEPDTLVAITRVLKVLDDSGVGEKLLLVDACRNDPEARGSRGVDHVSVAALPPQTGVLLSCSTGEFSFENKAWGKGHGAFFHQVIEGLEGAAKDAEGAVTFETLTIHVRKRVPRDVKQIYGADGGEQRPNVISNLSGEPMTLAMARITNPPSEPMPKPPTPSGKQPELLVAPFGAEEARAARKAWAKYQQIDEEQKNSIGMKLALIPAGEFQMGSTAADIDKVLRFDSTVKKDFYNDELPQHRVKITRPIYLGTYEVTKGEFRKFVDDTGYKTDAEKDGKGGNGYTGDKNKPFEQRPSFTWRDWGFDQSDESPVVNVSLNDAVAFCEWLSKKEGKQHRLPTEAEWEYACRGGTTSLYYNGDDPEGLTKIGNVADAAAKEKFPNWTTVSSSDGWAFTALVGQFRPNNFGMYDMMGNAWEWCSDWYDEKYYGNSPASDPTGPTSGSDRVTRGGSWDITARVCRSASRNVYSPVYRVNDLGFRVALVPSGK